MTFELVAIKQNGELAKSVTTTSPLGAEIIQGTRRMYQSSGYEPPWVGYLAFADGVSVGSCAFKSPPQNNRVEIAYFTFPEYQSRGIATRMATELVRIAFDKIPTVTVAAQTLPQDGASTSILKKLGFGLMETLEHPEDGLVWEWQLTNTSKA